MKRGAAVFYFAGDIVVTFARTVAALPSDMYGTVSRTQTSIAGKIKGTPLALTAESIAELWPYASTFPGTQLLSATPITICTKAGRTYTAAYTGLTKMPPVNASATNALIGEAEWSFGGTDVPTTENAFIAWALAAFADATFDSTKIFRGSFNISLDAAALLSKAGIQITFGMTTSPDHCDELGDWNYSLADVDCTATITPYGLTVAQWEALQLMQGANALPIGGVLSSIGKQIIVSKTGSMTLTLPNCTPVETTTNFGSKSELQGPVKFQVNRTFAGGLPNPLWTFLAA